MNEKSGLENLIKQALSFSHARGVQQSRGVLSTPEEELAYKSLLTAINNEVAGFLVLETIMQDQDAQLLAAKNQVDRQAKKVVEALVLIEELTARVDHLRRDLAHTQDLYETTLERVRALTGKT